MLGKLINAVLDAVDASKGIPLSPGKVSQWGNHLELTGGQWHEMTTHNGHSTPANGAYCNQCGGQIGTPAPDVSNPPVMNGTTNLTGRTRRF